MPTTRFVPSKPNETNEPDSLPKAEVGVLDAAIVVRKDEVSGEVTDDHLEVSDRPSGLATASVDESSPRIRSAFAHGCGRK